MRITVAFNLRTDSSEETAELLTREDVDRICGALREARHQVVPVEVSGPPDQVVARLLDSAPELIFNCAEGTIGSSREAFYPGLYEQLRIPFTGGNPSLLHMNLDKHLAKTVVAARGVRVPQGGLVTPQSRELPPGLHYPAIIKPNAEGSSKGVTQDSVVESATECEDRVAELLMRYPAGLVVEEFIAGRELSVPILEAYPGKILAIVEHTFDLAGIGGRYNVYDYDMKQGGERARGVGVVCPAPLTAAEQEAVVEMARRVFEIMHCPDLGRVDIRLADDGTPYFIELNPLPSLHPVASLMIAGRECGLEYRDVLRLVVRSAARRYNLAARPPRKAAGDGVARPSARELGIRVGRFEPGPFNAITDVKGVRVGHATRLDDAAPMPGSSETACVRSGVTAIVPGDGDVFRRRVVAGGFVLNGVGEMAGLTQALEWGYIETPILLTNSLSVGRVLHGVISHMVRKHPEIGTLEDPVLPVVGEADDSFLNDTRAGLCTAQDAQRALEAARGGAVPQGSVGAGTGMISFDCYFNNSATAAEMLAPHGTVAILDIDYHHGNGTQEFFERRADVFTCSIHGDPRREYPYFWGYRAETGRDAGEGANLNLPLPLGSGDEAYLKALDRALRAIRRFRPAYLIVGAGFDTHAADPIGGFTLGDEVYDEIGRRLTALDCQLLICQEGGYNLEVLGGCVRRLLGALVAGT